MLRRRIKYRLSSRFLAGAALALVLTGAASCSSVWDDVSSFIEDDEANDQALENSGDNQDFPKLSEVPDTIRPASSPEDLDQLAEGLVADRDEARYTNETLRSRYADDSDEGAERMVADAASAPEPAPRPVTESSQEPAELAEQRRVEGSATATARTSGDLADERRVSGIEPASDAVLQERRTTDLQQRTIVREGIERDDGEAGSYSSSGSSALAESRQVEGGQSVRQTAGSASSETIPLSESRVASATQTASASVSSYGVMPISDFRELFNARFDSSGKSPYQNGQMQQQAAQIAGDSLATDRALSPGSENMVRAQMELAVPEPSPAFTAQDSGLAAISFQAASIPFAVGSAALNSSDRTALKKIVKLHEEFGGMVRVIGHSSRRTRDMESDSHQWVNFQLSLDRATAVSVELTRLGVPADAVLVMARSDNEPLTHEYMPRGEAENRRADVYIEY